VKERERRNRRMQQTPFSSNKDPEGGGAKRKRRGERRHNFNEHISAERWRGTEARETRIASKGGGRSTNKEGGGQEGRTRTCSFHRPLYFASCNRKSISDMVTERTREEEKEEGEEGEEEGTRASPNIAI